MILNYSDVIISVGVHVDAICREIVRDVKKVKTAFTTVQMIMKYDHGNKFLNELVFVGTITPFKGVHHLIEAVSFLPSDIRATVKVSVVGRCCDEEYYSRCLRMVKEFGLEDNIKWMGNLEFRELSKLLERSGGFVFPSLSENMSMALLEAMSAGCVPICFDNTCMSLLIENEKDGFLATDRSSKDLSKCLSSFLALSDDDYARMQQATVEKSRRYVREWEDVCIDFEKAIL